MAGAVVGDMVTTFGAGIVEGARVVAWAVGMGDGGETTGAFVVGALVGVIVGTLVLVGSGDGGETTGALVVGELVGAMVGNMVVGALVGALEVVGSSVGIVVGMNWAVGTGVGLNVGVTMVTMATKPVVVTLGSD